MVLREREREARPAWWRYARHVLVLALLVAGALSGTSVTWPSPRGLAVALALLVFIVGWLGWLFFLAEPARALPGTAATGVAGVAVILFANAPTAWSFPLLVCLIAGRRIAMRYSVALATTLAALLAIGGTALGRDPVGLAIGVGAIAVGLLAGLARRQADELREKTRQNRAERERAEQLSERSRMAREVHDVLAHALGALTVQLETADALLEAGRHEQARSSVLRAGQLAREGLAETRRAIGALRGEPVPWQRMVTALAEAYEGEARVTIAPAAPELPAEVALALYRTAQEAMTNVRKHAPGAAVDITVGHSPGEVTLSVVNGPAPTQVPRPLAGTGGGYGIAGMRERTELAGGTLVAGPDGPGWRVHVRIPL